MTVTEAARVLGVARQTINNLVNEKAGISAEMAVRLSKAFGPSPEMWVRLQANYDLSRVRQDEITVAQDRQPAGRVQRQKRRRKMLLARKDIDGHDLPFEAEQRQSKPDLVTALVEFVVVENECARHQATSRSSRGSAARVSTA